MLWADSRMCQAAFCLFHSYFLPWSKNVPPPPSITRLGTQLIGVHIVSLETWAA